jgi:hypothetical protein
MIFLLYGQLRLQRTCESGTDSFVANVSEGQPGYDPVMIGPRRGIQRPRGGWGVYTDDLDEQVPDSLRMLIRILGAAEDGTSDQDGEHTTTHKTSEARAE